MTVRYPVIRLLFNSLDEDVREYAAETMESGTRNSVVLPRQTKIVGP